MSDEHAELGAPVSHVVDAQGLVAEVLHEARDAVTNDGGAEVPHVHLLGDVGRREVDGHALAASVRGVFVFNRSERSSPWTLAA